ncbi:MAG: hypothetical protein II969_14200 [Anaerolineaceae bacterium]|nr:hypothetical protein [Anaerolineaceae bacterium]
MFEDLENMWEPLYAPETSIQHYGYIGALPKTFDFLSDSQFIFEGETYTREERDCYVRESGPDAWGYRVDIPNKAFFRWINFLPAASNPWYMSTADQSIWVESAGGLLEIMRLLEDESLEWILYKFLEM